MKERLPRSGALLLEASRSLLPIMVKGVWWVGMVWYGLCPEGGGFGVRRGERQGGEGHAGKLQSDAVKRQTGNEEEK
jgi:hypothetical protein